MYIEISPTTPLPAFELYLDGNGTGSYADANDNVTNQATQLTYLDGNFDPGTNESSEVNQTYVYSTTDNGIATRLVYNFPRQYPAVCAYYIDGVQSVDKSYFDGNNTLITNTLYLITSGDGKTNITDGNAPSEEVFMTMHGHDLSTFSTGDLLDSKFVFLFPQFMRVQENGVASNKHYHYGPLTLQDKDKRLESNISFIEADFDYSIDTTALVRKRGFLYPSVAKLYTDILNYNVVVLTDLLTFKGETVQGTGLSIYKDKYGITTPAAPRLLIVDSGYSDNTGTVYDAAGAIVDTTNAYVTIAFDPEYTGVKYYLYDVSLATLYPSSADGLTVTVDGREEWMLKGVILYQHTPYWGILQYMSYGLYRILSKTIVEEELSAVRNKDISVVTEFNKELTT